MFKLKTLLTALITLLLLSCASSMSPSQISDSLPKFTKATFYNQAQANEVIENGKCKILIEGRSYVAPIGFTVKDDLKYGARGIDEWVEMDGGNAYTLTNYKWVTVDDNGSTQLHVEFNTMLCK